MRLISYIIFYFITCINPVFSLEEINNTSTNTAVLGSKQGSESSTGRSEQFNPEELNKTARPRKHLNLGTELEETIKEQEKIYKNLIEDKEVPDFIKTRSTAYTQALKKLQQKQQHNPDINIQREMFLINKKYNLFLGGYL